MNSKRQFRNLSLCRSLTHTKKWDLKKSTKHWTAFGRRRRRRRVGIENRSQNLSSTGNNRTCRRKNMSGKPIRAFWKRFFLRRRWWLLLLWTVIRSNGVSLSPIRYNFPSRTRIHGDIFSHRVSLKTRRRKEVSYFLSVFCISFFFFLVIEKERLRGF